MYLYFKETEIYISIPKLINPHKCVQITNFRYFTALKTIDVCAYTNHAHLYPVHANVLLSVQITALFICDMH